MKASLEKKLSEKFISMVHDNQLIQGATDEVLNQV